MSEFLKRINSSLKQPNFLPMNRDEMAALGWNDLDVLLVTGDAYIDHSSFGVAIIGRILISAGYRVGIISQPNWRNNDSLRVMGKPRVACGVTSGNLDSMLNIFTSGRRLRKEDSYSENGTPNLRPQMALSVYSNLVKSTYPDIPIFLGGIEASMRRITHYDYWKDKLLPSVLTTSKADVLIYGMGERTVVNVVDAIKNKKNLSGISGTAFFLGGNKSSEFLSANKEYLELPSFEDISNDKKMLLTSFEIVEKESNPYCGKGLFQKYGNRVLIIEKPEEIVTTEEMDKIYELPFANEPHPSYKGKISAFEMIKHSITSERGCPGGCSFCGLAIHQGKFISTRSKESIIKSVEKLKKCKHFRGTISDIGGPTANIYGDSRRSIEKCKRCKRPSCLWPTICENYIVDDSKLSDILNSIGRLDKIKHIFISSGIRLDLAKKQPKLMKQIVQKHTSGHLKIAPEHIDEKVLTLMRKNKNQDFLDFIDFFDKESKGFGKEQYLVPYFISNFPGCDRESGKKVDRFLAQHKWSLQQVQDFIPLPMTIASAMYYSGIDMDGKEICVNRGLKERREQLFSLKKKR